MIRKNEKGFLGGKSMWESSRMSDVPGNFMTWGQLLSVLLMWPVQTVAIFISIQRGCGYEYVITWLVMLHLCLYRHYYDVSKGKKLYCYSSMYDYPCTVLGAFSLPLTTALCLIDFVWLPPEYVQLFATTPEASSRNLTLITWIKDMDFLHVPRRLNPAIPEHASIIYTFALAVLSGTLGTVLSIPLWWPASKGWKSLYTNIGTWKSAVLGIFLLFLAIDIPFAAVWAGLNFGFRPVLRHFGSLKYVGYTYSDLTLFKVMAPWTGIMTIETCFASGVIGLCSFFHEKFKLQRG